MLLEHLKLYDFQSLTEYKVFSHTQHIQMALMVYLN